MPDDEPAGRTREPSVGDQRGLAAEARAHERTRRAQHLGHARRALGAHVPEDDDGALGDLARRERGVEVVKAVEDLGPALEAVALLAGQLRDGAVGREVAAEDGQVAALRERVRQYMRWCAWQCEVLTGLMGLSILRTTSCFSKSSSGTSA